MNEPEMDLAPLADLDGVITAEVGHVLHDLARAVPADRAIVEVGSYLGKSTAYLAAGAPAGAPVFAVDPWESVTPSRNWQRKGLPVPSFGAFLEQLTSIGLANRVIPLQGRSTEVAVAYGGPPVGLLYIDGDHRAGAAESDFHAWSPHLADVADIVFDDYGVTHNPEVAKDVARLAPLLDGPVRTACSGRLAIARWRA